MLLSVAPIFHLFLQKKIFMTKTMVWDKNVGILLSDFRRTRVNHKCYVVNRRFREHTFGGKMFLICISVLGGGWPANDVIPTRIADFNS